MPSTRLDEARDYAFADKALALRERARLTQRDLAARLGVTVRGKAARRTVPFDPIWFASLPGAAGGAVATAPLPPAPPAVAPPRRDDWGDAPAVGVVHGRASELDMLTRWVREERCRV